MNTLTFHVEREGSMPFDQREYALDVCYRINRFHPATHLQPAEGGDCEIISITHDGEEFELTYPEGCALSLAIDDDAYERANDEAEYRADMRRDEQMLEDWT